MPQIYRMAVIALSFAVLFGIRLFLGQTSSRVAPTASDGPRYVAPSGSDANDGLSEKTAKLTVMAAYAALSARGGMIYIYDGASCNSLTRAGIWIMGKTDPNYKRPPSGWAQMKGGSVTLVGIPKDNYGPNAHMGRANLATCGSDRDINHPGIWISGVTNPLYFQNLNISGAGRGVVIGEDSNHGRSGKTGGSSGLSFLNVTANPPARPGLGPPWDIVGGSFWIYLSHIGASGLDFVNRPADNNAAAILLDGTGNDGIGYIFIDHANLASGGVKINPGTVNSAGQSIAINVLDTESQRSPAAVWFTGQSTTALVQSVHVSDPIGTLCNGSVCAVENDGIGPAENTFVADVLSSATPMVKGPMLLMSSAGQAPGGAPFVSGQGGFQNGYVYANTDVARRNFAPAMVRFPNQAYTSPSNWSPTTGALTTGISAPDGTNGAGRLSNGSSIGGTYFRPASSVTVSDGDVLMVGVWERLNSGTSWPSPGGIGTTGCTLTFVTPGYSPTGSFPPGPTDGQWYWASVVVKIATVSKNPCSVQFAGISPAKGAADFYAPFFARIPARTYSDNEIMMIYHNLQTFSSSCAVGTICGLPGQVLVEAQYGTLSNCHSSASPAICGSAAAGSIVVAVGSGSLMVNTSAVTSNSQILVTFDSSLGSKLGVACNTTYDAPYVSARKPGANFTISVATHPTSNPACYSYSIIN